MSIKPKWLEAYLASCYTFSILLSKHKRGKMAKSPEIDLAGKDLSAVMKEVEDRVNEDLMNPHRSRDEKEEAIAFECRMPGCGSTEYVALTKSNGIRGPNGGSIITGYECCGCSIKFGDPAKFSNRGVGGY